VEHNDEKQQGIREAFTDSRSGSVFNVLIMRKERKGKEICKEDLTIKSRTKLHSHCCRNLS
jgi:hypothetical protein